MTVKFKPLDLTSHWTYGVDYWNIVALDTAELFWNLLFWGLEGRFPPSPDHIINYWGNPECYPLITFYPNEKPPSCSRCKKKIDWECHYTFSRYFM